MVYIVFEFAAFLWGYHRKFIMYWLPAFVCGGAVFYLIVFFEIETAIAQTKVNSEGVIKQAGENYLKENEKNAPKDSYLPPSIEESPFALPLKGSSEDEVTDSSNELTVTINSIALIGATAIDEADFKACYQKVIGHTVGEAELVGLSDCITQQYISTGYSVSRAVIPEQDVEGGRLVVKVIEGYISRVKFEGGDAERFKLASFAQPLTEQRPLTQDHLERHLLLISDMPGVSLEDTGLREIGDMTGNFELTVKVKTWQVWTSSAIDNRGTEAIGPYQSYQNISFNSLFGLGETIGVSYSSIADSTDELNFGLVSLDMPLNVTGMRLSAYFSGSLSEPSDFLKIFNTKNTTLAGGVNLDWNILRKRDHSLWIGTGVWGRNSQEENDFGTYIDDKLYGLNFYVRFTKNDQWGGENFFSANLKQGLDVWDASSKGDFKLSRFDGDGEFTKFNLNYFRNQIIDENWSIFFSGTAQLSSTSLLASQEFYFGGARYGRAYQSGVVSGDAGTAASLELRYSRSVDWGPLNGYQVYGFADIGTIWDRGNDFIDDAVLSSAGFGARLYLDYGIEADLAAAFPLDDDDLSDAKDAEFFFKLSRSYKLSALRFDQPLAMLEDAFQN
jgi:hemolysin activation/secretion protein